MYKIIYTLQFLLRQSIFWHIIDELYHQMANMRKKKKYINYINKLIVKHVKFCQIYTSNFEKKWIMCP